jgi:acyl-CoA thioesterase
MQTLANRTVSTIYGHTIVFEKGKPTFVPDDRKVIGECQAAGAVYCEATEAEAAAAAQAEVAKTTYTPEALQAKLFELFARMKELPDTFRENFTAMGRPNVRFVNAKLETDLSTKELEDYWLRFNNPVTE